MSFDSFPDNQSVPDQSVRSRFLFSILTSFFRGGFSFLTGLMVARSLGPESYGSYVFLIGSFLAIQQILEMGTTKAFFTFICKEERGIEFIKIYLLWQLIQFFLPLLVIGTLLPDAWISSVWIGENRMLVLLSCAAVFLQQNAWQTVIQIGESKRLTQKVQALWLFLVITHFILVLVFWLWGFLSLTLLFGLIIIEYASGLFLAEIVLSTRSLEKIPIEFKKIFREYAIYCTPLVIYSWSGFAKEFADRWLLQKFGGGIEQGLYGVAYQFALVCGLFTMSIHKIFWKEIAEAREKEDLERVKVLYKKVNRLLFAISGVLSGLLIPWSPEIIQVTLGASYMGGAGTLAVMLLFSVYRSLGQITGALYLASQETKARSILGIIFMLIHIPVTYFIQAPGNSWLPGLEMGSLGMALKMAILQIVSANVLVWWISRDYGWKYDWNYQIIIVPLMLGLGWACHEMVLALGDVFPINLFLRFGMAVILYILLVGWVIWKIPHLAGLTQKDMRDLSGQILCAFKIRS